AEFPAGRQGIVAATAKEIAQPVAGATDGPGNGRLGGRIRQLDQVEERIEGRVPAADDEDALAGIALTMHAYDVGDAGEKARGQLPLADGRHAGRAEGIGGRRGAGGVDDRLGEDGFFASIRALHGEDEWGFLAPSIFHLVDAIAGDLDDAGVEPE